MCVPDSHLLLSVCVVLLAAMSSLPILAASATAAAPTPPIPAALSIAELDALYAAGQLHGKQRDAARKRKERREKTAATIAALHLPDNEVASAFTQLRKSGVKVNPLTDTNKKKGQRQRTAACRAAVALQSRPAVALQSRPSLQSHPAVALQLRPALHPRPVAASPSRPAAASPAHPVALSPARPESPDRPAAAAPSPSPLSLNLCTSS